MIRYVVRPAGIMTTPRLLVEAFNARATRNGGRFRGADYQRDFLLYYPESLRGVGEEQMSLLRFARSSKAGQRYQLSEQEIPVPATYTGPSDSSEGNGRYIVRPLRHRGGSGWRVTEDRNDFNPSTEYLQELYPKTHEYRVIFVYGEPLITLLKRVDEGAPVDQPWNHTFGSRFVTVHNEENNRLRHTDAVERLKNNSVIKAAHIVGADIMYNRDDRSYRVAELNFAPALTIEDNIRKVAEHVIQASR